jgi:hypothetical protein
MLITPLGDHIYLYSCELTAKGSELVFEYCFATDFICAKNAITPERDQPLFKHACGVE